MTRWKSILTVKIEHETYNVYEVYTNVAFVLILTYQVTNVSIHQGNSIEMSRIFFQIEFNHQSCGDIPAHCSFISVIFIVSRKFA